MEGRRNEGRMMEENRIREGKKEEGGVKGGEEYWRKKEMKEENKEGKSR